ncbi:hypothetical protein B0A52_07346 [Exophiala mesophila]|uniref:Protein kinase domain-containing protein n=1 Tax=Exophiala mesophila TaxID=212818 RepID=A0A438MYY8_EXOME|nr:hypothetical protein B0A52_07346 [Exophiala mesophila]
MPALVALFLSLAVEIDIYQRLGSHPSIPKVLKVHDGMLILERLQGPLRQLLLDWHEAGHPPEPERILRWATQIARGYQHFHGCNVFQVDIGLHNALLDDFDNAKVCDFAGSSLDGSPPTIFPSQHAEHPNLSPEIPSVLSELFALGSLLYELETARQPYSDKEDAEVEELFRQDQFPDTEGLILGKVIA